MKFFIDSAEISEIRELASYGLLDGVTTNPSLIAKSGRKFKEVIAEICAVVDGPVSAEVAATDYDGMIREGEILSKIAKNVCIKLPLTMDGLKACKYFSSKGIQTNVTLCFSAAQAILAAKAGATFISPFVGRLDDIGQDGLSLIEEICAIYANYPNFKTEILVASVRHPIHITIAAKMGAHVATIPGKILKQLASHPLTDKGLETFVKDWASTGQKID
ncbi:MAG: fructose-6-phosphate aldolase [Alphaproteobacteria bacterium RIFCSPLOWO2_01_FULL_40_26]|nr:MAG: fructose-6-phosphate aldolase [Alphaproteobacteria bacterium RIFCSPHIGHO2_02_FULL_40_34]OFW87094.1 MAG: fructose-6-phosphate aldolase [Alphaproteobacteria bacterium RIFCSPHIGHO2_01_FULL_40_8]OFW94942.1 MAG: fructose-6-phosphate aldolase [Alphaproteobacteria bacterium RIFCSPLOWO2_01_FULL_40_26]OFX09912.1 MAG: fructose-6-phosphate aldolase [Alphaproteobacteria bacterium RIFCSPLOWO2_02_FULL_40_19]OFX10768.1 MAG: fructose-6-phosphate aldolase [Alphaproteobacteria bacterium RIFCSPLOWO2_12_FU